MSTRLESHRTASRAAVIPRPVRCGSERATRTTRAIAALLFSLARTIEFALTVLHRIPMPVHTVRASHLRGGPVIFVANHRSLLDTPFIRWSMPRAVRRQLATVGGYDFFEPREKGWRRWLEIAGLLFIVHGYRVWMIDRRLDGAAHLAPLTALLDQGWSILLYPEGKRSRNGRMGAMQPGAALLSIRTGAPIVPMFISGTERVLPPGVAWPRHGCVRIRSGDPLRALPGEHADAFMRRIATAVAALSKGQEHEKSSLRLTARDRAA